MAYGKYYIYKEKVSYDSGHTWEYTGVEVTSGDPIAVYDTLSECEGITPYSGQYLTFIAQDSGAFGFAKNRNSGSIQYKKNDGEWITDSAVTVNSGDVVMWKGEMTPYTKWPYGIGGFQSTCNFVAEGNVMSLLYGDNFVGQTDLSEKGYAFWCLFYNCINLTNIDNLVLPATTLSEGCYALMFNFCSSLTSIPSDLLPATTLASNCYQQMFDGCDSLTSIPSGLLPATTLAEDCYRGMFDYCSNITTAPILSATTLADRCYHMMFYDCPSLNSITCLATDISADGCTGYWVNGVAANGTFVKNSSMSSWTTGNDGIPSGWTVQNYIS